MAKHFKVPEQVPILIVSAVDSSGAAGMAIDIRVAQAFRHPVRCAVTALTVQDDHGVLAVNPSSPAFLSATIAAAAAQSPGIGGVKIGAVGSLNSASALAGAIRSSLPKHVPVVLDPVLRATSGQFFLNMRAYLKWIRSIAPLCSVVTPNRVELFSITSHLRLSSPEVDRARAILDMGANAVLVTGGATRKAVCEDHLYLSDRSMINFAHARVGGGNVRGTGCALSTALACRLGIGEDLRKATGEAARWLHGRILRARKLGRQKLVFP